MLTTRVGGHVRGNRKMLKNGIIQPSTSPWSANVLMVTKPNDPLGGLRYCVDYRYLNKFSITDSQILPRIDDLLDSLQGAEVFSMMDAAAGFWGVEIKPEDRHLTAFNTWTHGSMEFVRMPFGLKNAPGTFQRAMMKILHPLNNDTYHRHGDETKVVKRIASLYIDDICCHGSVKGHVNDLCSVFKRLRTHGVSLKMAKCEFDVTQGKFLGHIVNAKQGIIADPGKVQGILQMGRPKTVSALRTLLGATSYLRSYIPDFSDLTRHLRLVQNKYPTKHSEITDEDWDGACDEAFRTLQASLAFAPLLAFPDFTKAFII